MAMENISRLTLAVDTVRARSNVRALSRSLNEVTNAGERASAQARATATSYKLAAQAAIGYVGIIGATRVLGDLQRIQNLNVRLNTLTGDLARSQQFLSDTSRELSVDFLELGEGYARLLPLYQQGLLSLDETQTLTRGLANATKALGASNKSLGLVLFGLAQGLSTGVLRAEELNQATEPLPGLLAKLDEAAGLAAGGFRKLTNEGKITSEFYKTTFVKAVQSYEGAAIAASSTITAQFARTRNAYLDVLKEFDEPLGEAISGGAGLLEDTLTLIARNAEVATTAIGALAVAIIGVKFKNAGIAATTYAKSLSDTVAATYKLAAVERTSALGTSKEALTNRIALTSATVASTTAELTRLQTIKASIPVGQKSVLLDKQIEAAKQRVALATYQQATATNTATAALGKLTLSQKTAAATYTLFTGSVTALKGAFAALGGVYGVVGIAAAGLGYLALKETEAEARTRSFEQAMKSLNAALKEAQSYGIAFDTQEARTEAQVINELTQEVRALNAEIFKGIEERDRKGPGGGTSAAILEAESDYYKLIEKRDQLEEQLAKKEEKRAEAREQRRKNEIQDLILSDQDELNNLFKNVSLLQDTYDKLLPDDSKIADLQAKKTKLEALFRYDTFTTEEQIAKYEIVLKAIDDEIKKLTEAKKAWKETDDAAREYAEKLKAAFKAGSPQQAALEELQDQLKTVETEFRKGTPAVQKYAETIANLKREIQELKDEIANEPFKALNEALSRQGLSDPFESYKEDLQLFLNALGGTPEEVNKVNLAIAKLNFGVDESLTTFDATKNRTLIDLEFQYKQDKIRETADFRNLTIEQERALITELGVNYGNLLRGIQDEQLALVQSFVDKYSEAAPDSASKALDDAKRAAEASLLLIQDDTVRNAARLGLQKAYQDASLALTLQGIASEQQAQEAGFQATFEGLVTKYRQQIDIASNFADAAFGFGANRERLQAEDALKTAQTLAEKAAEAQKLYEETGTEANKILAKQAKDRAIIAENAAKREFQQQKKAQLQQAKLSQMLAIINAFASGNGNFLVGAALAVTAKLRTQQLIDNIRATKFNGGDSTLSGIEGNVNGGVTRVTSQSQAANQPATNERIIVVSGNFKSEDEALAEAGRTTQKLFERRLIVMDGASMDFRNLPREVVRL